MSELPPFSPKNIDGKIVVSIIGDAFCDVMCHGVTNLPTWGGDEVIDNPVEMLPGGSAANCGSWIASLAYNSPVDLDEGRLLTAVHACRKDILTP